MSDTQDTVTEATTASAVVEEASEAPVARKGWVKSTDGRYHEVEDIDSVLQAYPGQYEEVKKSDVEKNKVGWADEA